MDSGDKAHANVSVLADHRSTGMQQPASTWTPRELLLSLLNQIDSGEIAPKAIVVCISNTTIGDDTVATLFRCSSPDLYVSLGLMEHVKVKMLVPDE